MKRITILLAMIASLALPVSATAQVSVETGDEQIDFSAPAGQCITVDVKRQHRNVWKPVKKQGNKCVSDHTFRPDSTYRSGKTYVKYRVTQVLISGGTPTIAPVPPSPKGMLCDDGIDNDNDGNVDLDDHDYSTDDYLDSDQDGYVDTTRGWGDNGCDRGTTPITATPTAVLRTGWIRVKTRWYPGDRIYQYVNGHYNDSFFNLCYDKPKRSVNHGNIYCIYQPAFTVRSVALRAP